MYPQYGETALSISAQLVPPKSNGRLGDQTISIKLWRLLRYRHYVETVDEYLNALLAATRSKKCLLPSVIWGITILSSNCHWEVSRKDSTSDTSKTTNMDACKGTLRLAFTPEEYTRSSWAAWEGTWWKNEVTYSSRLSTKREGNAFIGATQEPAMAFAWCRETPRELWCRPRNSCLKTHRVGLGRSYSATLLLLGNIMKVFFHSGCVKPAV